MLFVDAPVSGSKEPAENGQLLILASGPDAAVNAGHGREDVSAARLALEDQR